MNQEHFNKNQLKSDRFPVASFQAKIIESPNNLQDAERRVNVTSKMTIHGVTRKGMLTGRLSITEAEVNVTTLRSTFRQL